MNSFTFTPAKIYVLRNNFIEVGISDFGASVHYIIVNTPEGGRNVCIGCPSVDDYLESGSYCGATIGRASNRIEGAKYSLNGREYKLSANEGGNCLHGGKCGFDQRYFEVLNVGDTFVELGLLSRDGDQGFGGNLKLKVRYMLISTLRAKATAI